MTTEQAFAYMQAAYKAEVLYRGREYRDNPKNTANLHALAKALTDNNGCCGVVLLGWPGVGKTTMLYAFQNALNRLNSQGYFDKDEPNGISIYNARYIAQAATDNKEFKRICDRPMLAIEDLGTEPTEVKSYGNIISPVVELIYQRYDHQLFTFITTNFTAKKIREEYGDRVADRLNEMMVAIPFEEDKNETYRKPK